MQGVRIHDKAFPFLSLSIVYIIAKTFCISIKLCFAFRNYDMNLCQEWRCIMSDLDWIEAELTLRFPR